jgi:penicillin V acylase-like amidase (Ntn superfamily)
VGVFTNEPTFDWHQQNIEHYEWKRTLARQAVAVPGNFYPEERFLRAYMVKSGMQSMGLMGAGELKSPSL